LIICVFVFKLSISLKIDTRSKIRMPSRKKTSATTLTATATQEIVQNPVVVPEPTTATATGPTATATGPTATTTATAPSAKKKSKKPVQVVAVVTPEGIEGNFQPVETRRSLIAHLHVHSNEINFTDNQLHYDPSPPKQPEPYDEQGDNVFSNFIRAPFETEGQAASQEAQDDLGKLVPIVNPLGNPQTNKTSSTEESKSLQPFYRCNLMVMFKESQEQRKLPDQVDIACFWCTECFTNQPFVIPEREEKGFYKVYGNFCCTECALSFLLQQSIDPHVRWERMALLHRMYADLYPDRIFPAPPRDTLKKFGGPMSIEQYRNTIHSKVVRVDIQMPPLVSILGTMDTKPIDFYDTNTRGNNMNGILNERINKAEEGLRLKRNKPLKYIDSTLDACMKISIKTKGEGQN
jgi:hypothetical protein